LESLTSIRDKLKTELCKQEEMHHAETTRLIENLERVEKEKNESAVQYQEAIDMFKRDTVNLEKRATKAEMENVRLQREISELENERASLRTNLNSSMAKVNELRRAIAVLESNPSTSTTVGTANKGLFSCPLCGQEFGSLANMQLHAEDCCT
uniref:C2H2-type domain-containing protein n=1 Tax=Anopheles atroparvus TaxID=41427 RepID=A0A182ILH3_ANOAO